MDAEAAFYCAAYVRSAYCAACKRMRAPVVTRIFAIVLGLLGPYIVCVCVCVCINTCTYTYIYTYVRINIIARLLEADTRGDNG